MSEAYYETGGLRFWNETEIEHRNYVTNQLKNTIEKSLTALNRGWKFFRIEAPILTAMERLSGEYTGEEVFILEEKLAEKQFCLRPETTPSSYVVARQILCQDKPPLCVWQLGKSFRREKSDGASPSKLRFNEFYQCEFQCIYSLGTKADYKANVISALEKIIPSLTAGLTCRIVESDRLPNYSRETIDIEVLYNDRWTEIASISIRTDFSDKEEVLEIAFGADRLVEIANRKVVL